MVSKIVDNVVNTWGKVSSKTGSGLLKSASKDASKYAKKQEAAEQKAAVAEQEVKMCKIAGQKFGGVEQEMQVLRKGDNEAKITSGEILSKALTNKERSKKSLILYNNIKVTAEADAEAYAAAKEALMNNNEVVEEL